MTKFRLYWWKQTPCRNRKNYSTSRAELMQRLTMYINNHEHRKEKLAERMNLERLLSKSVQMHCDTLTI